MMGSEDAVLTMTPGSPVCNTIGAVGGPSSTVYARAGVYASGVGLVLRSRQFPTFAFNCSKKFSTT